MPLDGFVTELLEVTGYRAMLEALDEEGQSRLENIGQLVSSVKTYADQKGLDASLEGFLEEVALISDIDSYDEQADVVVLMTMHAAKGLEFDYVFIVGLEEGIFPSEMSRYSNEDLEEERRLCYVGITRARKELYLSSANSRMMFGQTRRNKHSRFLDEIDPQLLTMEQSPTVRQMQLARQRYQSGFGDRTVSQNGYLNSEYNRTLTNRGYGQAPVNITVRSRTSGTSTPSAKSGQGRMASAIQAGAVTARNTQPRRHLHPISNSM